MFIVGAGGTIRTSPDAISWTGRTSGITNYLEDVTYGNKLLCGCKQLRKQIHTSTDGINLDRQSIGKLSRFSMVLHFGNNLYVVVGNDGVIRTSPGIPEIPVSYIASQRGQTKHNAYTCTYMGNGK